MGRRDGGGGRVRERVRERDIDPDFRNMIMMLWDNERGHTCTETDSNRVLCLSNPHKHGVQKTLKRTASLITNRIIHDSFLLSDLISAGR